MSTIRKSTREKQPVNLMNLSSSHHKNIKTLVHVPQSKIIGCTISHEKFYTVGLVVGPISIDKSTVVVKFEDKSMSPQITMEILELRECIFVKEPSIENNEIVNIFYNDNEVRFALHSQKARDAGLPKDWLLEHIKERRECRDPYGYLFHDLLQAKRRVSELQMDGRNEKLLAKQNTMTQNALAMGYPEGWKVNNDTEIWDPFWKCFTWAESGMSTWRWWKRWCRSFSLRR